jgi:hypothetical protein
MCDTLGRLDRGRAFFAKNSDRSPNEAQILEHHPRRKGLSGMVDCTYISIPQVEQTYEVLLSRPVWMWGAEMGVNEFGLCIGNEAVFTTGAYGKTGLTGMDMVRLALERTKTAAQARDLLISLLEQYGQGGNCGFDHDFYYDNAFLIMDRQEIWVLETAGKHWVYKKYDEVGISNRLSIGADGDGYSGGKAFDFCKRFTEPLYTTFSGSRQRRAQSCASLRKLSSTLGAMEALRQHDAVENPFAQGSVSSVCMHYGAMVGDHTTASMVVSLEETRMVVWVTGSSTPCVSLFKPWLFGTEAILPVIPEGDAAGEAYWRRAEQFRRNLLGRKLPREFYAERDAIQNRWAAQAQTLSDAQFPDFSKACLEEESAFYAKWERADLEPARCAFGFRNRWEKKNNALK